MNRNQPDGLDMSLDVSKEAVVEGKLAIHGVVSLNIPELHAGRVFDEEGMDA